MKAVIMKISILFLLAVPFLMSSCIDSETDPVGFGDAFILVEIVDQDTLMGLGLHAFSYSEFSSVNVQVTGREDLVYTLQPYLGFKQDYVWNTPLAQYTSEPPVSGSYVFNATFKGGQTQTFSDILNSTVVYPPIITSCEYLATSDLVDVEWETVTNADSYNVKLLAANGDILFVSPVFNRVTDNYSFGKTTQGWQTSNYPANGQAVIVEVAAYLIESGASGNELQSIGKAKSTIVWGN
jgi:hypothetical protein